MPISTIDLFAGAGGITEGFRQMGATCLFANDMNTEAIRTFRANHPDTVVSCEPIQSVDPREVRRLLGMEKGSLDVLVGGPPCQGFSINAPGRFLSDPRNSLFRHYMDFVDEFLPKTLMFENVPGMLSLGKGVVFRLVIESIEARGYFCIPKILFSAHYGVPQERWRLVILASRISDSITVPSPTHFLMRRANFTGGRTLTFVQSEMLDGRLNPAVRVKDAIFDLPEPLPSTAADSGLEYPEAPVLSGFARAMRGQERRVFNHVEPRLSEINLKRLRFIAPGGSWRDIPHELLPDGMKRARRSDHTKRYGRLHPDGLASTIMTKCDPHWGPVFHPLKDRTLTVREAARFQSFPDRYRFAGSRVSQYEQVGNAVPPLMARAVAGSIASHLGANELRAVG